MDRLHANGDGRVHDCSQDEEVELALVGDLTEQESDIVDRLLNVPPGGRCTMYIDSPGGSPYSALSLTTLILLRRLHVTAYVTGECSSAALWPFAACAERYVTPYSVLLFHPMKWQSEEHVGLAEAAEWARHFGNLERDMDRWLAELLGMTGPSLDAWMRPGRYVSGREVVEEGLAQMIDLTELIRLRSKAVTRALSTSSAGTPSLALTNGAALASGNHAPATNARSGKRSKQKAGSS